MDDSAIIALKSSASGQLSLMLSAIATRDPASLRSLYEATSAKLYGICLSVLGNETEAQDVLQEVFVTVWRKASLFDQSRASAITWLATIARNRSVDRLRRRRPTEDLDLALEVADGSPSSLDVLEQGEDAERLRRCLGELDVRARKMIRAAFFDGASYPQLAKREGVPLPTMKSWIRRGLLHLRECLQS